MDGDEGLQKIFEVFGSVSLNPKMEGVLEQIVPDACQQDAQSSSENLEKRLANMGGSGDGPCHAMQDKC